MKNLNNKLLKQELVLLVPEKSNNLANGGQSMVNAVRSQRTAAKIANEKSIQFIIHNCVSLTCKILIGFGGWVTSFSYCYTVFIFFIFD